MTDIGDNAFDGCTSLTSVTIGNGVTSIGEAAFEGCDSLEKLTVASGNPKYHSAGNCVIETATNTLIIGCKGSVIPDDGSVTSIGDRAFQNCTSLTSVTIPDSVRSIGDIAFSGCVSLTSVNFEGTKEQWYAVVKYSTWKNNCPLLTEVKCSDGTVFV